MEEKIKILPHLFRTEYSRILAVLCRYFGKLHITELEDIVNDTFLKAAETWPHKELPPNPAAWLHKVARNKAIDRIREEKRKVNYLTSHDCYDIFGDDNFSEDSLNDSQLTMLFSICSTPVGNSLKVPLALNVLCGFGVEEIAAAYSATPCAIYKRLQRAKQVLQQHYNVLACTPSPGYLQPVLEILYVLFNEGYFSLKDGTVKENLCYEAIRLMDILLATKDFNTPAGNALMALMCFQASRFEARERLDVLYDCQDAELWDKKLINKGNQYLYASFTKDLPGRYQLEATIAYWHTHKEHYEHKWTYILQLYDALLIQANSEMVILNRVYAFYKVYGHEKAIAELHTYSLEHNHFYHTLLGVFYMNDNKEQALYHFNTALAESNNKSRLQAYIKSLDSI